MTGLEHETRSDIAQSRVQVIDPLSDPRWNALIQERPSLIFHAPEWMKTLKDTYGFQPQALLLLRNDRPAAGLPFVALDDQAGKRVVSLPFSDFCDPLAEREEDMRLMVRALGERFPGWTVKLRFLEAPDPDSEAGFVLAGVARWHGVPLYGSPEDLLARARPSFRRAVRIAEKQAITPRPLKRTELRRFYEMHLAVRKRRYRLLPQPYAFFENLWRNLVEKGMGFFLAAELPGRGVIAAHCLLEWRDTLTYKFGASDYRVKNSRANHLLHFEAARLGLQQGRKLLDLGLSDDDQPGLIRYKRSMGAQEKEIRFFLREGEDSRKSADFKKRLGEEVQKATAAETPDRETEKAGERLYRYFA